MHLSLSRYIYVYIYKWHVCLGSYILEQEESRDIRKQGRVGEQGREEIRQLVR